MLKFEPDVGLISAAVKWIARLIMSDNVRLLDAEIGSREPVEDLVLWHIPVENQRRKLRPVSSVANCSVDLGTVRKLPLQLCAQLARLLIDWTA